MNWRPANWENHYGFMTGGAIPKYENQFQAFEAGADAMLQAIKPLIKKIAPLSKLIDILEIE